jgi:MFS family permease
LWIALSAISDGVTTLVLPVSLRTGEQTSEALLGLIGTAGLIVGMVAQPFVGSASDRFRQRFGRVGVAGFGVGFTVVALACLAISSSPAAIALSFAALCLGLSAVQAPQQALAADVLPANRRGRAAGAKGFADLIGSMIGFGLLGSLVATGDVGPGLLALAAILVGSYLAVWLLLGRADRQVHEPETVAGPADEARSSLLVAIASRFLFLLGIYAVGRFLVPFIAMRLAVSIGTAADLAGGLLTLLALVTAIGSIPAGIASDRAPAWLLMAVGAALAVAGIAVIAIGSNLTVIAAGGIGMAAGTALFVTANWRLLLDLVAGPSAGRLLGIANIGTAGAAALAGLGGPAISLAEGIAPGAGYPVLFGLALVAVGASAVVARPPLAHRGDHAIPAIN